MLLDVKARERVAELLTEFVTSYLSTAKGRAHLAAYPRVQEIGRLNVAAVLAAAERGEDTTDLVLLKLLPHVDSPFNRESGAWIHIAPAVTRDIKSWFERKGWTRGEDWPKISAAILQLIREVEQDAARLPESCRAFSAQPYTHGFQSGLLSPILNAIRPDEFSIVNSKKRKTMFYLAGVKFRSKLSDYSQANEAVRGVIGELSEAGLAPTVPGDPDDVFDAFAHWLIAIKKIRPERERKPPPLTVDAEDRASVGACVEHLYPEVPVRDGVLRFLSAAIEEANRYGPAKWKVAVRRRRIRMRVGGIIACELVPGEVRVSLPWKTLSPLDRAGLEQHGRIVREFATRPAVALWGFRADTFLEQQARLRGWFGEVLKLAAGTARGVAKAHTHSNGMISYLEDVLKQPLPRPSYALPGPEGGPAEMKRATAITRPRIGFKKVDYDVAGLLNYIDIGDIGLPEIQRPFVWSKTKVRDLFDSMYRGFPVGYLLFWANTQNQATRQIGPGEKQHQVPALLIVDGQQRLTSLYAVFRGKPVLDDEFREMRIEIAFRPRDGQFEVSDPAIARDPEFIANISEVFASGRAGWGLVNEFLARLESKRKLDPRDKELMGHNLERLLDLGKYPFTALEISSEVDEEAVSDIFVRINSEGVKLNQGDFILTLLSVFWEEGRRGLETFAQASRTPPRKGSGPSPFNHFIQPRPDQLLRVSIATGFHRARLRSVYQLLRGKDLETGEYSADRREAQFSQLKLAQEKVLDLNHWHLFLGSLVGAGFRSSEMVSSENALLYTYALYLLGKLQCGVEEHLLSRVIGRWFFASTLSGRYTGSPETVMEADLNRIKEVTQPEVFVETLERIVASTLTNDVWEITLPAELETSSARQPAVFAYYAAQNKLAAPVLFSDKRVGEMLDPALRANRKALERHHLYPRRWLERNGVTERKAINQVANFALLEWPDNVGVGSVPPSEYVPKMRAKFSVAAWDRMCRLHALPEGWETLSYDEFLERRRVLMAQVIRRGFETLSLEKVDGDAKGDIAEGTSEEQPLWRRIAEVERGLRKLVRQKYEAAWGPSADARIRQTLGEEGWSGIERNRARYQAQYPRGPEVSAPEILEFCYLGQLMSLMTAGEAWAFFKQPFRDKRELEDLVKSITPVRNDAAHFRSVPLRELERCRLAIGDLMALLARI